MDANADVEQRLNIDYSDELKESFCQEAGISTRDISTSDLTTTFHLLCSLYFTFCYILRLVVYISYIKPLIALLLIPPTLAVQLEYPCPLPPLP